MKESSSTTTRSRPIRSAPSRSRRASQVGRTCVANRARTSIAKTLRPEGRRPQPLRRRATCQATADPEDIKKGVSVERSEPVHEDATTSASSQGTFIVVTGETRDTIERDPRRKECSRELQCSSRRVSGTACRLGARAQSLTVDSSSTRPATRSAPVLPECRRRDRRGRRARLPRVLLQPALHLEVGE